MKYAAGDTGKTAFGEAFGPLLESEGRYHQPLYTEKNGQIFTFHTSGRYSNNPEHRHALDLVAK